MARKPSRRVVALASAALLTIYGGGYLLTESASVTLQQLPNDTLDPTRTYRDGTYTGTGASEFGDVSITLTIVRRRIVALRITGVTTSYAQSWIDGLPGQALARQSAGVDAVSGATYSSQAFRDAVRQAIEQASV